MYRPAIAGCISAKGLFKLRPPGSNGKLSDRELAQPLSDSARIPIDQTKGFTKNGEGQEVRGKGQEMRGQGQGGLDAGYTVLSFVRVASP